MSKILYGLSLLIIILLPAQAQSSKPINIAVAANLLFPMQQIEQLYEAKYKDNIHLISASSGVLTAQINNGAPYHLFFSADMKYPQQLAKDGKTLTQPKVLVSGKLACWSRQNLTETQLIQFLKSEQTNSIAIAQPSLAPYGQAAKNWLEKAGVLSVIESKLVYGENVGQVNQYIYSDVVDVAFTAISAMFSEELKDKGYWLALDDEKENPALLAHGWVMLKPAAAEMNKVNQFVAFLNTPAAKAVFQEFGYIIP